MTPTAAGLVREERAEDGTGRQDVIYLDNNATTALAPEVLEAMQPYLTTEFFNPSSAYERAQPAARAIREARQEIAGFLGAADPSEILFTSCATESINAAVIGAARANTGRRRIITTSVEHPAVYELCRDLARDGYDVVFLPVDRAGRLDVRDLIRALDSTTLMVAIMHANNETGVVFPIAELSRVVKETDPKILFLTDATQTAGKLPLDLRGELRHVDLLAFSGHKLHAPKGIGVLYIRRGTAVRAYLVGGHQEGGRRGGTENVAFIAGLGAACALARQAHATDGTRIRDLRDQLQSGLMSRIPCLEVNGGEATRLDNTLNISAHFIEGEGILYRLSEYDICASSGSACTSGSLEPSHVLRAMRVPFTAVHGSIRFSFSRYNQEEDVTRVLEVFPEIVASLRRISPYWDASGNRPRPEAEAMMTAPPGPR